MFAHRTKKVLLLAFLAGARLLADVLEDVHLDEGSGVDCSGSVLHDLRLTIPGEGVAEGFSAEPTPESFFSALNSAKWQDDSILKNPFADVSPASSVGGAEHRSRSEFRPVAVAQLSGYDRSAYYEEVPRLTLKLTNLSPDSITYLRIYHGTAISAPSEVTFVEGSFVFVEGVESQDCELVLDDINSYLTRHGINTIEIVNESAAGSEVISRNLINVDRTVILPGGIYTRE